jgi:N-acylneuraminate cytidylyltransferase
MKLAVIPARGGSKRIPRKNIRDFCGKPIIAYSIEAALASNLFDQVIVSTDDDEIASVAREFGAETPFMRPAEIADDHTGTNAVVKHAVQWYKMNGYEISHVCCIYATAPFVQKEYLKKGHDKLINSNKSFTFSVTTFPFPIQRAIRINEMSEVEAFWPEYINTRSQDLEEAYHDAGQFYWGEAGAFLNDITMYSSASIPIILPRYLVQDIDSLEDWTYAEYLYEVILRGKQESSDIDG